VKGYFQFYSCYFGGSLQLQTTFERRLSSVRAMAGLKKHHCKKTKTNLFLLAALSVNHL